MALRIRVTCSNHQKDDGGFGRKEQVWVDTLDDKTRDRVRQYLERREWVVQLNGDNMDTYCSEQCAE